MSGKTKRSANRAVQALRQAAAALRANPSALGTYFRRTCTKMDKANAVTAVVHKLARLIYSMLSTGQEYTDQGRAYYEDRSRQRALYKINRRAHQLGMKLVPTENAPAAA